MRKTLTCPEAREVAQLHTMSFWLFSGLVKEQRVHEKFVVFQHPSKLPKDSAF